MKVLAFAMCLLLAACTSSRPRLASDDYVSPNFRRPPTTSLIVLLPTDFETEDLRPGAAMLMNALHQKLTGAGYKVLLLDQASHDTIWTQEVKEVGGIYDPNNGALRQRELMMAVGHLVQRVSAETGAAMVIRPQLVLREAELSGMSAAWDGQQRRLPIIGTGVDEYRHSGATWGLSVGLQMIAASGELVMSTHGGALLPYRVNIRSAQSEVRPDLFANEREVEDGVVIALTPFLKM